MEDLESSVLESSGVQQQQQHVVSMFVLRLCICWAKLDKRVFPLGSNYY